MDTCFFMIGMPRGEKWEFPDDIDNGRSYVYGWDH